MRLAHHAAAALALAGAGLLAASCGAPPAPGHAQVLPFIDDDYARARDEARSRKLPIFAESWAPW